MSNTNHDGYLKLQAWVKQELWEELNSQNITSPTSAVTQGLQLLLDTTRNTPKNSQGTTALEATIEGLKLLLQEKDERISDLRRETETLNTFAHYFKSLDYRRLENPADVLMEEVKKAFEKPASKPERSSGKKVFKKICKECGEEFDALSDKAQTCSSKCRSAYSRQQKKSTI